MFGRNGKNKDENNKKKEPESPEQRKLIVQRLDGNPEEVEAELRKRLKEVDAPDELVDDLISEVFKRGADRDPLKLQQLLASTELPLDLIDTPEKSIKLAFSLIIAACRFMSEEDALTEISALFGAMTNDGLVGPKEVQTIARATILGMCMGLNPELAKEKDLTPRNFVNDCVEPFLPEDELFFEMLDGFTKVKEDNAALEELFKLDSGDEIPDEEKTS